MNCLWSSARAPHARINIVQFLVASLFAALILASSAVHAVGGNPGNVVISQVYGGGGNSGAPYQNDFVELFNRSAAPVNITGWSVQYASATGTGNFGANPIAALSGTLQPGQYYLVQLAGGATGAALPAPDATGTVNMSGSNGKVALINTSAGLACNGGGTPCSAAQIAQIVDLVGYGSANFYETTATATLSNTTAALRSNGGCADTDINNADFTIGSPTPRNSVTAFNLCGATNQPVVASCPTNFAVTTGAGGAANVSANDADGYVSGAAITSAPVSGIGLSNITAGGTLTAQLDVAGTVASGNYNVTITFNNNDATPQTAACTIAVNVAPAAAAVRIHAIQGAAHISPLNGQQVSNVPGIVTAVSSNGFWMQDPTPDGNPATSEGIFVFTSSAPSAAPGASVQVSGTVQEFRPGGSGGLDNLTITEITSPTVATLSTGNPLPAPTVLGIGGRAIPDTVIDDDATGNVETSGSFDAASDGIDFYESLEGMRVQINNPVAAGPTNRFGETPLLADNGVNAGVRSVRGGVVISATDFNPERIIIDNPLAAVPTLDVGDGLSTVIGVVDYSFGNFKLYVTNTPTAIDNGPVPEVTSLTGSGTQLTVASFNVENLSPLDPASKFAALADQIVNRLKSPDIVALMEVQDNNGPTNDGVVDASTTYNTLINAIQTAGGPAYQFRNINPADDQDGGQPGGNIRVGFLFNPARVGFVDRAGAGATTANSVVDNGGVPRLQYSPGRIDPTHSAFGDSRKPLAAEFVFNGHTVFAIVNHFNSKGGDDPLFGHLQPPVRGSEAQRHQQAAVVRDFVQGILAIDAGANIIVLGDFNDFEFSETLNILKSGPGLVDLVDTLPPNERYTYVYEGNSQVLDHILVSANLAANAEYDIVHVNSEYAAQTSDHEPEVARLALTAQTTYVDVTGQVSVYRSGLTYKRKTQTYEGTVTVTNTGAGPIAAPLQVELQNLTVGVTLVNATGTHAGNPYITAASSGLAPGASLTVPVKFSNPGRVGISYGVRVYSGTF